MVELDWTLANNAKALVYTHGATAVPTVPRPVEVLTIMGKGKLLETRPSDGVQTVELDWTLANNSKVMMYTHSAELTREEQIKQAMKDFQQQQLNQEKLEQKCLSLLQLLPTQPLPLIQYNKEMDPPRVHMSDFSADRKRRKVISLTLRGKNFTNTKDIEMHEDSLLLHLYLAIEMEFNIPMIHVHETTDQGQGGRQGVVNRTASPGVLLRRSWAQFTAGLEENPLQTYGGILKLDMVGCPSKEWNSEEALGSLGESWVVVWRCMFFGGFFSTTNNCVSLSLFVG